MASRTFTLTIKPGANEDGPQLAIREKNPSSETHDSPDDLESLANYILSQALPGFVRRKSLFSLGSLDLLQSITVPASAVTLAFAHGQPILRFFDLSKVIGPVLHPGTQEIHILLTYDFKESKAVPAELSLRSFLAKASSEPLESDSDTCRHTLTVELATTQNPFRVVWTYNAASSLQNKLDLSSLVKL